MAVKNNHKKWLNKYRDTYMFQLFTAENIAEYRDIQGIREYGSVQIRILCQWE